MQKHDASHLHYDFRLELDGVLKSWAVPKGPSLDPGQKRLAIQVEDHPLEYGSFEGVIPQGEYGGGTVLLWDRGDWQPLEDPHEGLRRGRFKFTLHGEKLQGDWALVRRNQPGSRQTQWLLFKTKDRAARPQKSLDITAKKPLSVASGRDLADIAAAADHVWSSAHGASSAENSPANGARGLKVAMRGRLSGPAPRSLRQIRNAPRRSVVTRSPSHPAQRSRNWPRWSPIRPTGTNGCTKSNSTAIACSVASTAVGHG